MHCLVIVSQWFLREPVRIGQCCCLPIRNPRWYWRIPKALPADPDLVQKIHDAVEFARLACNRWRYYHRQNLSARSVEDLERVVQVQQTTEVALVLIVRPAWDSPIPTLGIAHLRRTWCNHLFLEFLALHPQVLLRRREKVSSVGLAMLHQIVALAERINAPCIRGEATEGSHTWYEQRLAVQEVRDHFFIEEDVLEHCLNEMRGSQEEMLARRGTTQEIKPMKMKLISRRIRSTEELCAIEDKSTTVPEPSPVTFAARHGLKLSKPYVTFMRSQKSSGNGARKFVQSRRKLVAA